MQSSFRSTPIAKVSDRPRNLRDLYQLRISLEEINPPIWRRLLVASSIDLAMLHEIIQLAMSWSGVHLHQFTAGRKQFGVPDEDYGDGIIPERGIRIGSLLKCENQWISYEYDFGDAWEHKIVLEKILPYIPGAAGPECIDGQRGAPPEDVGGAWGYREFLEAYTDRGHPDHWEKVAWVNGDFDPERFDIPEINRKLKLMRKTAD